MKNVRKSSSRIELSNILDGFWMDSTFLEIETEGPLRVLYEATLLMKKSSNPSSIF